MLMWCVWEGGGGRCEVWKFCIENYFVLWPTHNRDYNYDDDDDYDVMEGGGGYVYKEVLRLWLENLFNSFYSFWCCSLSLTYVMEIKWMY